MKRIGIVGCGHIAQVHAWALSRMDQLQLVACTDIVPEHAEKLSGQYTNGKAAVYEDYSKMLVEIKPDVVHICTPHHLHVPMAISALKKDCSVFMEKPPAITQKEFDNLKEIEKQSKGRIGFCFQNRYNDTTKELDRIVAEGILGEVIGARGFVTWRRDESYYSDDWHGILSKEGGGALINQSIHTLDLMLRYLGSPTKLASSIHNHHLTDIIEVEDTVEAWMEFEKGKRACFYASTAYVTDAPVILELSFENGRVTMIDRMITVNENGKKPEQIFCDVSPGIGKSYWGNGHLLCIQDFYEALSFGAPFQNDISGVENTLRTTMNIYKNACNYSSPTYEHF